jgi:hypothetical protein
MEWGLKVLLGSGDCPIIIAVQIDGERKRWGLDDLKVLSFKHNAILSNFF